MLQIKIKFSQRILNWLVSVKFSGVVKVGVGYSGKEARYKTGKFKRLKEKFTFIGTGKDFMEKLSLLAEERLSLSKVKKVIFGGDGDSWITSGIKDYFPSATYILDLYHLYLTRRADYHGFTRG